MLEEKWQISTCRRTWADYNFTAHNLTRTPYSASDARQMANGRFLRDERSRVRATAFIII